jgi:hypothetical protein
MSALQQVSEAPLDVNGWFQTSEMNALLARNVELLETGRIQPFPFPPGNHSPKHAWTHTTAPVNTGQSPL